ncbi:MAG: DMT family transporter [Candidatus Acidiferrum sp.]
MTLNQGRLYIVLAAVLWSTSGAFTRLLTRPTVLGLNEPLLNPLQIACGRVLFAGLVLLPMLRKRDLAFRPAMLGTAASFALMNGLFVYALASGSAANAILLQYTAPIWMVVMSVWLLREPVDKRGAVSLAGGMMGVAVIITGSMLDTGKTGQLPVIAAALGSGVTYAGVLIGLRITRDLSATWLTIFNHLISAAALVPFVWNLGLPTPGQTFVLLLYGGLQMGLPYWLVARGLSRVSPQEAGTLTLLEPILNPIWAYFVSREPETVWTFIGGSFILGALAYRYWPFRKPPATELEQP